MAPRNASPPPADPAELFDRHAALSVGFVDESVYRRFRAMEPRLVSQLDGGAAAEDPPPRVLALSLDGCTVGIASFVVRTNHNRGVRRDLYARIDLVIVAEAWRCRGFAQLLVLGTLGFLLETYGKRLYSISCLAAHGAIERILGGLGFEAERRDGADFVHEEMRLDDDEAEQMRKKVSRRLEAALGATQSLPPRQVKPG